ncbi:MAG: hypothetical protein HOO00_00740 [Rhodospirillaceae bacterium]|jgi:hypothetical protein|nr:hypothetical protein [Rhodospirillaceae bacterium]MBT5375152.1 hypothetical protein [Rhodospirillaceae bacterium]MBT5659564.1 hypothetical protein [Rhodospirillaceae bacterium]
MKSRSEYWENAYRAVPESALLYDGPYIKSLMFEEDELEGIREEAYGIIEKSLEVVGARSSTEPYDEAALLHDLNQLDRIYMVRDWDVFARLESRLIQSMKKRGILEGISGMEFPMNIRVMHGKIPPDSVNFALASHHLHSDLWADEPEDSLINLLYLGGDVSSTYCEFYDFPQGEVASLEAYRGPYSGYDGSQANFTLVPLPPAVGQFAAFDIIVPHKTTRLGGAARISIDFRLRRDDPYCSDSEAWNREHIPLSRYWLINPDEVSCFAEKCRYELGRLKQEGDEAGYEARRAWIQEHTPDAEKILRECV